MCNQLWLYTAKCFPVVGIGGLKEISVWLSVMPDLAMQCLTSVGLAKRQKRRDERQVGLDCWMTFFIHLLLPCFGRSTDHAKVLTKMLMPVLWGNIYCTTVTLLTVVLTDVVPVVSPSAWVESRLSFVCANTGKQDAWVAGNVKC